MMSDVGPDFLSQLDTVFAQLTPQEVEEFYATYQQWRLQQRINELRQRIEAAREQQAHNQQRLEETRPPAVALAALARLQSNGVSDLALLDAMLERGENWLDQTMQRLDYFEQFDDFISDDYTKWCQGALEGAFDWIDSLRESSGPEESAQLETPLADQPPNNEDAGDVEALLLQRLASENEQDDLSWQEATTLKQPVIKAPPSQAQEPPAPDSAAPQIPFIVEAGVDAEEGGYPRGRLRTSNMPESPMEDSTVSIPESSPNMSESPMEDSTISIPDQLPNMPEIAGEDSTIPVIDQLPNMPESPGEDSAVSVPDQPATVEFVPSEASSPEEDELHAGDDQPAIVESALTKEPTPIEFAAPNAKNTAQRAPQQRGLIRTLIWIVTGK
jgi:hypothetical protein